MASTDAPPAETAWRIVSSEEWATARAAGCYAGNEMDRTDGYLHMSPASEVRGTIARYFSGRPDLVLLEVETGSLGDAVRWEMVPSRGAAFPHLYGRPLPLSAVRVAHTLALGADGSHVLPAGIP